MTIKHGDFAMMIDLREKVHVVNILTGKKFETHHGFILHDTMIGRPWGSTIHSSTGHPYLCVQPSTSDLIRHIKRSSQVIFPKDSAYIMMKMNIKPGTRVLESGCGSGGLTMALTTAVMPAGHVYSQEIREDFIALTKRNMTRYGLDPYVTFIHADGTEGFQVDEPVDAVFLDMPKPETCVGTARKVLKDGGWFGSLVPTTNQVQALLHELAKHPFGLIEVEEVITRSYKPVPERLRPRDRMIAHTGYLIFARAIVWEASAAPTPPVEAETAAAVEIESSEDTDLA